MHFSKLVIRSLRLPTLFFIIGAILVSSMWITPLYSGRSWHHFLSFSYDMGSAIMVLSCVLFAYLFINSILHGYKKILLKENKTIASHIVATVQKGLRIIFIFFAIHILFFSFEIPPTYLELIHKIVTVLIIGATAWIFLQVISTWEVFFYNKYASLKSDVDYKQIRATYTRIHQIKNVFSVVVIIIAAAAALMVFNNVRNIGISILASAGFLTAIIGLAAQKTLGSLFAGIQLAFAQPFHIGDSVTVENEFGVIEEITLSCVVIKISNASRLILPITYFLEKPFQNWSRSNSSLQGIVKLYVDYAFPVDSLRTELTRLLNETKEWDKKTNTLKVSQMKEYTVELTATVSASNSTHLDELRTSVREKLLSFICKNYAAYLPKHYPALESTK